MLGMGEKFLCITVTFLDSWFHGLNLNEKPEWPPSPMRLFQALLAGARTGIINARWNSERERAFRWLESQEPPLIIAPRVREGSAYRLFVPANQGDKKLDRKDRLTTKDVRPVFICGTPQVHYLWPLTDNSPYPYRICEEARGLYALGWGIDQAFAFGRIIGRDAVEAIEGERFVPGAPMAENEDLWPVPTSGSLDELLEGYKAWRAWASQKKDYDIPNRTVRRCRLVCYRSKMTMPPRPYAAFKFADGVAFPPEMVNEVAAMVRSLACRLARDFGDFPQDAEVYVAGHIKDKTQETPPRFSYLPLPSIRRGTVDGMIRRVLVAEPFGGDGECAHWASIRLRSEKLVEEKTKKAMATLEVLEERDNVLALYTRRSRAWSSVTPVVLPGFDDGKQQKAEKLLLVALRQAGLGLLAVEDILLRKAPFWPGALYPLNYFRPNYLRHLPVWHVYLRFREAVGGPIAIGAGRHCGFGLLAAEE